MLLKTVFLCDVSIRRNLCLQKVFKGGGIRYKARKEGRQSSGVSATLKACTEKRFSLPCSSFLC